MRESGVTSQDCGKDRKRNGPLPPMMDFMSNWERLLPSEEYIEKVRRAYPDMSADEYASNVFDAL
eukprot:6464266-Prymnesium_polylepis.1